MLMVYIPLGTKQVISETFFPANLLANTEESKPNTTKANIHLLRSYLTHGKKQ